MATELQPKKPDNNSSSQDKQQLTEKKGGLVKKSADKGGDIIHFRPQAKWLDTEPPRDMKRQIWIALIFIGIAFGGLGTWAVTAPLDSAAIATGVLVVESRRKIVQHLEGGIIKKILVNDGSIVKEGDPLLEIDNTRADANLQLVQGDLDAGVVVRSRLVAERDNTSDITFPPDLLNRAKTNNELADMIMTQHQQFIERKRSIESQIAILHERIRQNQSEIVGLQNEQKSRDLQLSIYQSEIAGWRELHKKGYFPLTRILASERDMARLQGERGTATANIARTNAAISETKLQIEQIKQRQREEVVAQLRDIQTQIADNRQKVAAAQDVVDRLILYAPVSGVVQGMRFFTEGGVVPPGTEVMQIIPTNDKLQIELQISPQDVEAVKLGMRAKILFPGIKDHTVPQITGIVEYISPDRMVDERTGMSYYQGRAILPPEQMALLSKYNLVAGMAAEVVIKIAPRTALRYFLNPLLDTVASSLNER